MADDVKPMETKAAKVAPGKPAKVNHAGEMVSRFVQIFLRSYIFEVPGLSHLKHLLLRNMFDIETGVQINAQFFFKRPHSIGNGRLIMKRGASLNHNVEIDFTGGVTIGRDVWISQNVLIETHDHNIATGPKSSWGVTTSPLEIGDDVWIGANVIITEAVGSIGEGAVLGAGAVVTKNVGAFEIVGGVPARVIGNRPR